jgi:hypothetical protein
LWSTGEEAPLGGEDIGGPVGPLLTCSRYRLHLCQESAEFTIVDRDAIIEIATYPPPQGGIVVQEIVKGGKFNLLLLENVKLFSAARVVIISIR